MKVADAQNCVVQTIVTFPLQYRRDIGAESSLFRFLPWLLRRSLLSSATPVVNRLHALNEDTHGLRDYDEKTRSKIFVFFARNEIHLDIQFCFNSS